MTLNGRLTGFDPDSIFTWLQRLADPLTFELPCPRAAAMETNHRYGRSLPMISLLKKMRPYGRG